MKVKTILVPIDFSVESLNTLKLALEHSGDDLVQAVLIYPKYLNDSITDLLFYDPYSTIESLNNEAFREGLEIVKNRYEKRLTSVIIRLYHGIGKNHLKVFVESHKIDEIYIPKTYLLKQSKGSIDIVPTIRKSSFSVFEMDWKSDAGQNEQEYINPLFI